MAADDLDDLRDCWRALSAGLGPLELLGLVDDADRWEQDQLAAVAPDE